MREQRKKYPKKNTSMIHDEQASRLDSVKYVKWYFLERPPGGPSGGSCGGLFLILWNM